MTEDQEQLFADFDKCMEDCITVSPALIDLPEFSTAWNKVTDIYNALHAVTAIQCTKGTKPD